MKITLRCNSKTERKKFKQKWWNPNNFTHERQTYMYSSIWIFLFKENNSIYNADWIPFSWWKNRLFLELFHFFRYYVHTKDVKTICEQGTINERHKKMESVLFISSLSNKHKKNQHRNKSNKKKIWIYSDVIYRLGLVSLPYITVKLPQ